jgi:hypothetical protein
MAAPNAFEYFLARENARVVRLLERNHDVSAAIQGLLESAVNYCEQKGMPFERLKLRNAYVIPTERGDSKVLIEFTFV